MRTHKSIKLASASVLSVFCGRDCYHISTHRDACLNVESAPLIQKFVYVHMYIPTNGVLIEVGGMFDVNTRTNTKVTIK